MRLAGYQIVAIDISTVYLKQLAEAGVITFVANAEKLPFKEEFDLIFMSDVLEHVLCPERVLQSVRRALRVGGKVIIRVPFEEDISQYSPVVGYKYEFLHLRSFNKKTFSRMIRGSGLCVKKYHYDGFQPCNMKRIPFVFRGIVAILSGSFRRKLKKAELNRFIRSIPWIGTTLFNLRVLYLWWTSSISVSEFEWCVARFPNLMGRLFFKPLEIVVVAQQAKNEGGALMDGKYIEEEIECHLKLPQWKWNRLLELLENQRHNPVIAEIYEIVKKEIRKTPGSG